MLLRTCCVLSVALCSTALSLPAFAAEGSDATVSGSGAVILRPAPTRLRMVMALLAHGKTPQVAVENLKARREAAVVRLKDLKADADSISFGAPCVENMANGKSLSHHTVPTAVTSIPWIPAPSTVSPYSPIAPPMQSMPAKKLPILFIATLVFRAEWPLADEGPDRLEADVAEIREKVRSAILEEDKAEQNLIEEAHLGLTPPHTPPPPYSASLATPARPVFVYVATLSDAQRKRALAQAFAKAKDAAAELAEAAGMTLGPIVCLSARNDFTTIRNFSYGASASISPLKKLREDEAVAMNADDLEFPIGISMRYRLLSPASKP